VWYNISMKLKTRLKLACAECGVSFERLACQVGRGRGRFCSRACLGKSKRHGSEIFCALCDEPFYRRFGEQDLELRKRQFCSRECYMEWRALKMKDDVYAKIGARHIHRLVAERVLGRPLTADEIVHHKDLNRHNNEPSNLVVFPNQSMHSKCHQGSLSEDEIRRFSIA